MRPAWRHGGALDNCIDRLLDMVNFPAMRIVTSVAAMQRLAKKWQRAGTRIGFVPTMGYLHEGHLNLMRLARRRAGKTGRVVVSIYVNPAQFGPGEDISRYPRNLKRDLRLCRAEGVDAVFAPNDKEMYPGRAGGRYSTCVVEERLSRGMEGASRPGHFRGVTTIVAKLFNLVQPDVAVFGAKDYQQAAVIKRMVQDLNFPVRIVVMQTLREPDGLAMSSRNKYLKGHWRARSVVLWRSIQQARASVRKSSKPVPVAPFKARLKKLIEHESAARLDYIEFFDPETLVSVSKAGRGTHMALAAFVGKTRLIDNARL
jgi:pantoate--beta-alanine ligase